MENDLMFIVKENETVDALKLQDFQVIFHMLRPGFLDNEFAKNCVIDIFYYFYLEEIPPFNPETTEIYIARKKYLQWVMEAEEFKNLKNKTANKKDNSLLVSVQIYNAFLDAYLEVVDSYPKEDIELIHRFTSYKEPLLKTSFLQDTKQDIDYSKKYLEIELDIAQNIIRGLEEKRETIIEEVTQFLDALLHYELELFADMEIPFRFKSE